jgi:hypothetical protein
MNAAQDAWAMPLAKRLITKYTTQALIYVSVANGAYDELTGQIANTETAYPAAGAVVRSQKAERDRTQQGHGVTAWISHEIVPWPISSNDYLGYLGKRWKVAKIESYGSGGDGLMIGPIYLTTVDGKMLTTLDGKPFIVQGPEGGGPAFTMYASKVMARAE